MMIGRLMLARIMGRAWPSLAASIMLHGSRMGARAKVFFMHDRLMEAKPSRRPSLLYAAGRLWLAWKEFDGTVTTVKAMDSRDDGQHWGAARIIAETSEDSDHPILLRRGDEAFLSWQTRKEGYRLIKLESRS